MKKRMYAIRLAVFALLVATALAGWQLSRPKTIPLSRPGFALSFDDRTVHEWYQLRDLFQRYNAKATFYVTQSDQLASDEINKLRHLQKYGCEIGSHGFRHVDATEFLKTNSPDAYMKHEIHPSVEHLNELGFQVRTFAYPYGANHESVEPHLEQHFVLTRDIYALRHTLFGLHLDEPITMADAIYCDGQPKKRVRALTIDNESGVTKHHITQALHRARKKGEIVLFYGHKPEFEGDNTHPLGTDVELIEHLFKTAQELGLQSYTMNEVAERD
ncbi:polysaccharide deacetylase family protein [Larkinella sp. VNQ87]|uniref:polysaccharide deacetylase family protein n=1 Tax=Larkinella sp. VNQ87 TaxID=3400921 RepID=UPI003C0B51E8